MSSAPPAVPSIVKTVTVPLDPAAAFALFTEGIGTWWPMAEHSVGGVTSGVTMTPRAIVEILADGTTTTWAEVVTWEPPDRFAVTWHPGRPAGVEDTTVAVTFEPAPGGTEVRLEHSGWEHVDPARRGGYDTGWVVVLDAYRDAV